MMNKRAIGASVIAAMKWSSSLTGAATPAVRRFEAEGDAMTS